MVTNEEYIEQLMSEKVAGIISREDEDYLDRLMEEYPQIAEGWEIYLARFSGVEIGKADSIRWKPVKKPSVQKRYIYYIAAAVTAGICIMLSILFTADIPHHTITADNNIKLRLATGETVNLSNTDSAILVPAVKLANQDKSLTYTADASAPEGLNVLTVPVGLDYKITLDDGTIVWMNAATKLEFPFRFNGGTREIRLDGEAYLDVAKDASRPFLVHTPQGTVKVLGTAFNVNSYDSGRVVVSLVEGAVVMLSGENAVSLKPGKQLICTGRTRPEMRAFDEERELSWRRGIFYFDDADLQYICTVLPRWYGIKVRMDSKLVARERFTGRIDRNLPVETFLAQLKLTTAVDYYFDKDGILHLK